MNVNTLFVVCSSLRKALLKQLRVPVHVTSRLTHAIVLSPGLPLEYDAQAHVQRSQYESCIKKLCTQARALARFLRPMLDFVPEKRATAAEMLRHEWLDGAAHVDASPR